MNLRLGGKANKATTTTMRPSFSFSKSPKHNDDSIKIGKAYKASSLSIMNHVTSDKSGKSVNEEKQRKKEELKKKSENDGGKSGKATHGDDADNL